MLRTAITTFLIALVVPLVLRGMSAGRDASLEASSEVITLAYGARMKRVAWVLGFVPFIFVAIFIVKYDPTVPLWLPGLVIGGLALGVIALGLEVARREIRLDSKGVAVRSPFRRSVRQFSWTNLEKVSFVQQQQGLRLHFGVRQRVEISRYLSGLSGLVSSFSKNAPPSVATQEAIANLRNWAEAPTFAPNSASRT
ncbi:MAG: hypothetical protein ACT4TC_04660 [Myxococcaceae bacterium]